MKDLAWRKKFDSDLAQTASGTMAEMKALGFENEWAFWEWKLSQTQWCKSWWHGFFYGWDMDGIHGIHCKKCLKRVDK